MRSNNQVSAWTAAEPSPRLVMAVLAVGMVVGALFTAPNKPTGPAADLARTNSNVAHTGDSK